MRRSRPTRAQRFAAPAAALAAVLFPACLENEEEILVREDGSVRVVVRSEGDVLDLADGYPVPFGQGWVPANDAARTWLSRIGVGPLDDVRRAQAEAWESELEDAKRRGDADDDSLALEVVGEFPSVESWPHWFASEADPYATAYLERDASLGIREEGGRRVYTFERTYRGRDFARLDFLSRAEAGIEDDKEMDELLERFSDDESFSANELLRVADFVQGIFGEIAELAARDAMLGIYLEGDASLPTTVLPSVFERVRSGARRMVGPEELLEIRAAMLAEDDDETLVIQQLERDFRERVRRDIDAGLAEQGIAETTRNAVLYALEWGFTAQDAYGEIRDEEFRVMLALPGTLVAGNFQATEDGAAVWEFKGDELASHDVVLRAVSVLD